MSKIPLLPGACNGITECFFRLERVLKIISSQSPCHGQGHIPLDQIAPNPIQPSLEHSQGWEVFISPEIFYF